MTAARCRQLFDYAPAIGRLVWRQKVASKVVIGTVAGTPHPYGYCRQIRVAGRIYKEHRLVWLWWYGAWPVAEIDHRNGDPMDNRIDNLRDVSGAINKQNQRKAHRGSTSPLLGVSWDASRQKWRAAIGLDGKTKCLGYFGSQEAAHERYLRAKREMHVGCTI